MNISVTCTHCAKRYQVDAALGGRTVKCKACGTAIKIPMAEDQLLEPLESASPPPPPPPAPRAVPAPTAAHPPEPDPNLSLAPPPMPEPVLTADGEVIAPKATKSMYVRVDQVEQQERDYRGYRICRPYTSGSAATLENLATIIGPFLFWIEVGLTMLCVFLYMIVLHRIGERMHVPGIAYFLLIIVPMAWIGVYVGVTSPLVAYAARQAGRILMFDIPEEPQWPMIAADAIATCPIVLGGLLIYLIAFFGSGDTGLGALAAGIGLLSLFALPLVLPVHFCLTWLVLRTKFIETLLLWPMVLLAHVVVTGTFVVLVILAAKIILY